MTFTAPEDGYYLLRNGMVEQCYELKKGETVTSLQFESIKPVKEELKMTFNIKDLDTYPKDEQGRPLVMAVGDQAVVVTSDGPNPDYPVIVRLRKGALYEVDKRGWTSPMVGARGIVTGPWIEPKPEYSSLGLPAWWWGCAMDEDGDWFAHETEPELCDDNWIINKGDCFLIPPEHAPKWQGVWQESAIVNSEHGEGEK